MADIFCTIRRGVGAFNDFVFFPDTDDLAAAGQKKHPVSMAQAILEIADILLAGGGDHGPMPVDTIALDAFIGINSRWSDGSPYKQRN